MPNLPYAALMPPRGMLTALSVSCFRPGPVRAGRVLELSDLGFVPDKTVPAVFLSYQTVGFVPNKTVPAVFLSYQTVGFVPSMLNVYPVLELSNGQLKILI